MIIFRTRTFSLLLQLIFLVILPVAAFSQSKTEMRKIFAEAESCNLFEEYELANPLYLLLDKPEDFNIQYKIGTCYLNIPGEKGKAISYLESAVKHSDYEAKTSSFKEKRAPLDAYFSLGKAYMINNQLDNAINTFETFKKLALAAKEKGSMKNLGYVDQEIMACNDAINYRKNPVTLSKKKLGKGFSQGSINENPAVSFDGNTIVYTERRGVNNAIMWSRKTDGKWQMPVEINVQLKCGEDCSSSSLNYDGTLLFLYKTDNYDGNIFTSEFINGAWTPIKKLNRNINTKYYESHASVSADGKKLYFTSNREGGSGGLDIYVSEKDATGDWGPATNLGNTINTAFNEDTPFITLNDSLIYFSSEGHSSMGGFDVFRSRRSGNGWSAVENMGYPVNSTDDDKFFQPFNNGENGYYSMSTGYKRMEIFYITFSNSKNNPLFEITGKYGLRDTTMTYDESNMIYLLDRRSGDTLETLIPEKDSGRYRFVTDTGMFKLVYTGPGFIPRSADTSAYRSNSSMTIDMGEVILDRVPLHVQTVVYEKLDLSNIPEVSSIDSSILIKNLRVYDVTDNDVQDTSILYYTVQVMALYNPVDVSYFRYVSDIRVFYNDNDLFYRYTTGVFKVKDDAYAHKNELLAKGYPDDLFIKKVTRMSHEKAVKTREYFTIQLKASKTPIDINSSFQGLKGVREIKESDGSYHYFYGRYTSSEEARSALGREQFKEFADAFVREISLLVKNK
jgi:hypothetical protein